MSARGNSHPVLAGLAAGGLFAAYAVLSHYLSILPENNPWAVMLALAPMLAMGLDLVRRSLGNTAAALAALLALAALVPAWPQLMRSMSWVYFLQHVALYATLGLVFARTLVGGRQPLCTFFASFVHDRMSAAVIRYTRQVTQAWALFLFAVALLSVLLFFLAPIEVWSLFANILSLPLVGLMFVADHLARRAILPPEDQLGPTAAFRAYQAARKSGRRPAAAPVQQP